MKNQKFTATDFIAAITRHIPERQFQPVRYCGWYSNRGRVEREKSSSRMMTAEVSSRSLIWPQQEKPSVTIH